MFHSQQWVYVPQTAGAPTAFLPRATSPIVEFHPSPAQPALQMETCLTSLQHLPIRLILLSENPHSPPLLPLFLSLLSPAVLLFPLLSTGSVCLPSSWMLFSLLPAREPCCLKLFQWPVFVACVLWFSKIHNFTSFSPGEGLRQTSGGLACFQMWLPPMQSSPAWVVPCSGLKGVRTRKEPEGQCGLWRFICVVCSTALRALQISPVPKVLQCHGGESQRRTGAWTDCWRASSPTPGSRQYQLQI